MKNAGSILIFSATLMVSGTMLYLTSKKDPHDIPKGISQIQAPMVHEEFPSKSQVISVTEICHAGYVYLVTSNGAITARIMWNAGKSMPVKCQL